MPDKEFVPHNLAYPLVQQFAALQQSVNMYIFIILILMITNFKCFFIKILELFINKQKPYNHSNYVHERWIVIKFQHGK